MPALSNFENSSSSQLGTEATHVAVKSSRAIQRIIIDNASVDSDWTLKIRKFWHDFSDWFLRTMQGINDESMFFFTTPTYKTDFFSSNQSFLIVNKFDYVTRMIALAHPYFVSLALLTIWAWPHLLMLPVWFGKDAYRRMDTHARVAYNHAASAAPNVNVGRSNRTPRFLLHFPQNIL